MKTIRSVIKEAGWSTDRLARELNLTGSAVRQWTRLPARRAREVQRLLNLTDAQVVELMAGPPVTQEETCAPT